MPLYVPTEAKVAKFVETVRGDNRPYSPVPPRQIVPTHPGDGGQCRDGRLQAGVFPGGDGRAARRARSRLQSARHARDHALLRADGHDERTDPQGAQHQLRLQLLRPGLAGQRHDRPRARPDAAQHRRRQARRDGPLDPGQSRQVHLLLRRERGRESLDALPRAARLRADRQRGDGDVGRRPAQPQRPRPHHRRRPADDLRRRHGDAGRQHGLRQGPDASSSSAPSTPRR